VGPAPAADVPPGWKLVASDDFTTPALGAQWGTYGGSYSIGANAWSGDEVSTGSGTLRVKMERKASGGKPFTSGGAAMWGLVQTYGRYEFDASCPTTAGIDSYITIWPEDDDDANSMLVELLDKPAVAPRLQAAYVTINYGSGTSSKSVPGSYCGAFHSYVIEWTPTYESVTVDGKLLLKSPASTKTTAWIGFITSNGDNLTGTPGPNDPLPAEFDIRHLRVYAWSPGAPGSSTPTTTAPRTTTSPSASASASSSASGSSSASATSAASLPSSAPVSPSGVSSGPAAQAAAKSGGASTGVALAATAGGALVMAGGVVLARTRRRASGAHRR
jgi:beta-glucanase (GH16 family)